MTNKSSRCPQLNQKAATALWRSDPIIPQHNPPKTAGGEYSSLAHAADLRFFVDFRSFADVVNWWLADEFTASRFRLQDLPDGDLSLNVDFSDGPRLGRSFAIHYNQTRVGRLEIAPAYKYSSDSPEVHASMEIEWARLFGFQELTQFLDAIAWHVSSVDSNSDEYRNVRQTIQSALLKTLWDNYRISELDNADDEPQWGDLSLSLYGAALFYMHRRDAPARPK